jgi:hypothetical protein
MPLAVCVGLLVMHALDDPSSHGHDHHAAAGVEVSGATDGHEAEGIAVERQANEGRHCSDCVNAVHVVLTCLAVLVAVTLGLSWSLWGRRSVPGALPVSGPRQLLAATPLGTATRPVWMRLAVMLC